MTSCRNKSPYPPGPMYPKHRLSILNPLLTEFIALATRDRFVALHAEGQREKDIWDDQTFSL